MISSGVYILKEIGFLVEELSGITGGLLRVDPEGTVGPTDSRLRVDTTVHLREREDGWCHVELTGEEKGTSVILDFLTGSKSLENVLVWDFDHTLKEYSYTFYRKGRILEQFKVRGPVLDSVSFVSDLRRVELKDLIRGFDFSMEAIRGFGIRAEAAVVPDSEPVRLYFSLPPKRSIWKILLGTLSGKE